MVLATGCLPPPWHGWSKLDKIRCPPRQVQLSGFLPHLFNPFHIHEGQLSGVCYLRVPPSLPAEYAKEDHYPTVGDICWFNGQAATFSGHKHQESPKVGVTFLFPNWLAHGVYPFRTPNEERRSVSFNLHLIKKDDTVIVDDNRDK